MQFLKYPPKPLLDGPRRFRHKWQKLIGFIPDLFPERISFYVDPFVGDGEMFTRLAIDLAAVNDLESERASFYRLVQEQDGELKDTFAKLQASWKILDETVDDYAMACYVDADLPRLSRLLSEKQGDLSVVNPGQRREAIQLLDMQMSVEARIQRMWRREPLTELERKQGLLAAFRGAFYDHVRASFNVSGVDDPFRTCVYPFLYENAVHPIRRTRNTHRNSKRQWTSPYNSAKIGYEPGQRWEDWQDFSLQQTLKSTKVCLAPFAAFMSKITENAPEGTFVLCCPPPLNNSSQYGHPFQLVQHQTIARVLDTYGPNIRWMVLVQPDERLQAIYCRMRKTKFMYLGDDPSITYRYADRYATSLIVKNY